MNAREEPVRDLLLGQIDFELERSAQRRARSGWNTRALLIAVGTIAWLSIEQLDSAAGSGGLSWRNVATAVLALSLATDALFVVVVGAELAVRRSGPSRFRFADDAFSDSRPFGLAVVVRGGVLTLLWSRFDVLSGLPAVTTTVYLGFASAAGLFIWLLSYRQIPVITGRTPPKRFFAMAPSFVLFGLLLPGLASAVSKLRENDPTWEDMSIAGLLWLLSLLLIALANRLGGEPPLNETLLELRRELVLGTLDPETARERLDIAVHGLSAEKVLQVDIEDILRCSGDALAKMEQAGREVDSLASFVEEHPGEWAEKHQAFLDAVRRSTDQLMKEALTSIDESGSFLDLFERRVRFLRAMTGKADSDVAPVIHKLRAATEDAHAKFKERAGDIQASVERVVRDAARRGN